MFVLIYCGICPESDIKLFVCSVADENAATNKEMNMGCLYDSVSGKGFSVKQTRSVMPNKNKDSFFQQSPCFRRFLVPEEEVSE